MLKIECVTNNQKRNAITILIDNEVWRDVHLFIFGRKLEFPACQTLEEFEFSFHTIEYLGAKNYALRALSKRNLFSKQLDKKLKERWISETTRKKIIQELQEKGYLQDQEWISNFVRIQAAKKSSPQMIAVKLQIRGVSSVDAEKAVLDIVQNQSETISYLLKTKYRTKNLSDFKEKQKVIASLARKGFPYEEIQAALRD